MSETTNVSGANADASGTQNGNDPADNKMVSKAELDKVLAEMHKYKKDAKDAQSKLSEAEQAKLLAEGKKDDVINSLQKKASTLEAEKVNLQKTYAWDKVNSILKQKAAQAGIIDQGGAIEKFVSLVDFKGKNPFLDEATFAIEDSVLNEVFETSKKEMPYFFTKQSPNVRDVNPDNKAGSNSGSVDFSKMSLEQLRAHALSIDGLTKK